MGKVFGLDWEPNFGPVLPLTNFSQLMSVSSGGVEVSWEFNDYFLILIYKVDDDFSEVEVQCWEPNKRYIYSCKRY